MASSMPTGQPVPEREHKSGEWVAQKLENEHGYNFITPTGYTFGFKTMRDALEFIVEFQYDGIYHSTMHGDKHYSDRHTLAAWSPDPWINKGWNHGDFICRKQDLTEVILEYAYELWMKNS